MLEDNDDKLDMATPCSLRDTDITGRMRELEEDLRLAKHEIKKDRSILKANNDRKHKGSESEYDELLNEAFAFREELNKLQSEKEMISAKLISLEKNKSENEVDECVVNVACEGNCSNVG